jgi:predicted nucleic acid-binding protein
MIVVSDTTPLISLLKIDRLDLLEKLFGQVLIPKTVFNELTDDVRFKEEAEQIKSSEYIKIKSVVNHESVGILKKNTGLDQGESEAIILTDEVRADILLMDEAKGRVISMQRGIKIMGTIGILIAAYENDIITANEAMKCIDGLQKANRHIGERHYRRLLERLKD